MTIQIKDIPFFHDLAPNQADLLKQYLIEKSFKKGEVIHLENTPCSKLFFVQSGRIKMYRTAPDGKEQIYEILKSGDTCACNPGNTEWHCDSTAEAVDESKVWFLSRENYVRMVRDNSSLMLALNELFAKRLQCFSNIIEEVALKDTKKRFIKFLLDMLHQKKAGSLKREVLFIEFTRTEIAQRLGTARETIARHISELKKKNLIDVKPYQIIIKNKEALEKLLV